MALLKIGTLVIHAPGNVYTNFGFLCFLELEICIRQSDWRTNVGTDVWTRLVVRPIKIIQKSHNDNRMKRDSKRTAKSHR